MSIFTVNVDRCNACGICVAECPMLVIDIPKPQRIPAIIDGGDKLCINCGHCIASCPADAISLDTIQTADFIPVQRNLLPSAEQAEHFLRSRRSIRAYKTQPVPHETLLKLIDIARYAPSGSNMQPVQWLVIEDTREVRRLTRLVVDWGRSMTGIDPVGILAPRLGRLVRSWDSGRDLIMRGAPHVIVTHGPSSASLDATIALTYLELAAYSLGLGACWAGFFMLAASFHAPMKEALNLPEGNRCLGAMMIGYPKHKFHLIPPRNEPRIIWR